MTDATSSSGEKGSSPIGRGGAGAYIEGELGAFYLLAMLSGADAHGLPGATIEHVQFQGVNSGFELDDVIVHAAMDGNAAALEIQSKRSITFAPKDEIFAEVCEQITRTVTPQGMATERHNLAVATQRTSAAISGPYQDVLAQARAADGGAAFFGQLAKPGVANPQMRQFAKTFRENLVAAGLPDDDEEIWRRIRRFQILEFDFESSAPLARTHAFSVARALLASDQASLAGALWSSLVDVALVAAKTGLTVDLAKAREELRVRGFRLAGNRDFSAARKVMAEMSDFALRGIGTTVAGVRLPRPSVLGEVDKAREGSRFVEIRGNPGVGKSAVLHAVADRARRESTVLVLDPVRTPAGGWTSLAQRLGVVATAQDFLTDVASSGEGTIFIDGLEMFTTAEQRLTVSDVLTAAGRIQGLSVVATARLAGGPEEDDWLPQKILAAFGGRVRVEVRELSDEEVAFLCAADASLRPLLAADHPSAPVARNLYRLSMLLKVTDATGIRTETALARSWFDSADGAPNADVRASQRILSDLAEAALARASDVEMRADSPARSHLLRSLTLREASRDRLAFYHDVLRDWAVAIRLSENPGLLAGVDLSRPAPPTLARGVELAARFALEGEEGAEGWVRLIAALSPAGAHGSWRRHALMAIVRSEQAPPLLDQSTDVLLQDGGSLLIELVNAVVAVDTVTVAELWARAGNLPTGLSLETLQGMRTAGGPSIGLILKWAVDHSSRISLGIIPSITKLAMLLFPWAMQIPLLAVDTARMLFDWLMQVDVRGAISTIPADGSAERLGRRRSAWVEDLRSTALLLAKSAPDEARSYLVAIKDEADSRKVRAVRQVSQLLSGIAPAEMAAVVRASLMPKPRDVDDRDRYRDSGLRSPFLHDNLDYMPESPAQPPFLDLLNADKDVGLGLIRDLTGHCADYRSGRRDPGENGFTLDLPGGAWFFPWVQSLFWSRDNNAENCVACALMALEAWSHERLDAGEDVDAVLSDVLGPEGGCAAYLMVAIDLLLSHWPATREALVPFLGCPELLAADKERQLLEQMGQMGFSGRKEPQGRTTSADLAARPSRGRLLEEFLPAYLADDDVRKGLVARLDRAAARLGTYDRDADTRDPAFVAARALNILNADNWVPVEGGHAYRAPKAEMEVVERMSVRADAALRGGSIQARVHLAVGDQAKGSSDLAREAADHVDAEGLELDDEDTADIQAARFAAVVMLVARDGDDALLAEREGWLRGLIGTELGRPVDRFRSMSQSLSFHREALYGKALIHLWCRRPSPEDREVILRLAVRKDLAGPIAASASLTELNATDPRMVKSLVRIGLAASRWRWHPFDEDEGETLAYEKALTRELDAAVAAEVAWLDGGAEPAWPDFPTARPSVRLRTRIRVPDPEAFDDDGPAADPRMLVVRADPHSAAAWLKLAVEGTPWLGEIVETYWDWTSLENGFGKPADAEIERTPDDWNFAFYAIAAPTLMQASDPERDRMIARIEGLPDRSFSNVVGLIQRAVDAWYFNDPSHEAARAAELRRRFGARAVGMRSWNYIRSPGDLFIDMHTADVASSLFMNETSVGAPPRAYVPSRLFHRVDPMLEPLRPILGGGPVHYIARCAMNLLLVEPNPSHADFLFEAVEVWLARVGADSAVWIDAGIGTRVVEWLRHASDNDPGLLSPESLLRGRMDAILSALVSFGVAEAHELEQRIAAAAIISEVVQND